MQVVNKGHLPNRHTGRCDHCGCRVSCTEEEYQAAYLWYWASAWVKCPTPQCGRSIVLCSTDYQPPSAGELGL